MGWLKIILLLIQYGPAIYQLVKQIIDLFKKIGESNEKSFQFSPYQQDIRLREALDYYKKTRDKEKLIKLRDELVGILGKD